jgi:pimeloyl-ACP methyl ester carboxylesterase
VAESYGVHVDDLLALADAYGAKRPVTAVGHSVGGTVVLGAAARHPQRFASIGVYEPSLPWLGLHPPPSSTPLGHDPAAVAEWFFRRLVGDAAWERMSEAARSERRADGPALLADLTGIRQGVLFDIADITVPVLVAHGGPSSFPHHVETTRWLARHLPHAKRSVVPDASHGAHLSHPDAFAKLVCEAVALGSTPE